MPKVPKDRLLAELLAKHPEKIWKYHDHDSLLENQVTIFLPLSLSLARPFEKQTI